MLCSRSLSLSLSFSDPPNGDRAPLSGITVTESFRFNEPPLAADGPIGLEVAEALAAEAEAAAEAAVEISTLAAALAAGERDELI